MLRSVGRCYPGVTLFEVRIGLKISLKGVILWAYTCGIVRFSGVKRHWRKPFSVDRVTVIGIG